ncbi:MAG: hybrid sensor histidine kinase/response regulator [Gemmatimonadales bacterium]
MQPAASFRVLDPDASRSSIAAILDALDDAFLSVTTGGIIQTWNGGAARLYGYSAEEAIGAPIALIVSPERREEEAEQLVRLGRGERIETHDTVRITKDGRRLDISRSIAPITDAAGRLRGFAAVERDITSRKQGEAMTARARDRFLAILAHELRNPLAPIRAAVETLQLAQETSSSDLASALQVMDRQLVQMTRLLDDLLDMSRITANKLDLRKEPVDLADILRSAVEATRPILAASDHELEVLADEPIQLHADAIRLAQAVGNLLNNAAKFTPESGRIRLSAERDGDQVAIRVRDTGIGIPGDMVSRIFEMFMQVEHPINRVKGGLGIGLTLAQRLIDMHGGTLTAASAGPGHGSEFTIRLPVQVPAESTEGQPDQVAIPLRAGARFPLRILIVDDNRDAADSLGALLRVQGHSIQVAYDSRAAIEAGPVFEPQAILLDIGLPGLNGYETAQQVRQQPWGRDLLLIAVTGWGQEDAKRRSWEAGFDSHLVKPVDPDVLVDLLGTLAEGRKPSRR